MATLAVPRRGGRLAWLWRRARFGTGYLFAFVLLAAVPVTYASVLDQNRTTADFAAADAAEQGVVVLFGVLMDTDQSVHRYVANPTDEAARDYYGAATRFEDQYVTLANFVAVYGLTRTSQHLGRMSRRFGSFQYELALPVLTRHLKPSKAQWSRGEDLIENAQHDLIAIQSGLIAMRSEHRAALEARSATAIALTAALLFTLSALGLLMDFRRLRERKAEKIVREERAGALERSNAALQDFAHVASHDLQEPLRMVSSYTQLLARRYKGKLDADADTFIGYAVDGAKRMQGLIENILSYSRISSEEHAVVAVDTGAAYHDALANLEGVISETGAHVTAGPLPQVLGDKGQLGQLFQNLIGNALKYRSEAVPEIEVTATRDRALWSFSVRDNGIGIAEEYRERVFRMFQRLHAKTEYSGTGIGLAVCRRIVERHGGTIWVDSPPGHGTIFHFTLRAA
jgi:signal transduction histidine kinase